MLLRTNAAAALVVTAQILAKMETHLLNSNFLLLLYFLPFVMGEKRRGK